MCAEELKNSVESIEAKAEVILKEARNKSSETLLRANEEANKILSSELALDEVKLQCAEIINKAKEEADRKIEEAKKKTSEIKVSANEKVVKIVGRVASNISGAEFP